MKITINIPEELLKDVDTKAKSMYLSRSAYINMTLGQQLQKERRKNEK